MSSNGHYLQSLPRLFTEATDFAKPGDRIAALSALSSIDSLNRNQTKAVRRAAADKAFASTAQQDSLMRGQRQVQQVKLRLGLQIEDKQFQQMIADSGVSLNSLFQLVSTSLSIFLAAFASRP